MKKIYLLGIFLTLSTFSVPSVWGTPNDKLLQETKLDDEETKISLSLLQMDPSVPLENGQNPFDSLSNETKINILEFLDSRSMSRMRSTCWGWRNLITEEGKRHFENFEKSALQLEQKKLEKTYFKQFHYLHQEWLEMYMKGLDAVTWALPAAHDWLKNFIAMSGIALYNSLEMKQMSKNPSERQFAEKYFTILYEKICLLNNNEKIHLGGGYTTTIQNCLIHNISSMMKSERWEFVNDKEIKIFNLNAPSVAEKYLSILNSYFLKMNQECQEKIIHEVGTPMCDSTQERAIKLSAKYTLLLTQKFSDMSPESQKNLMQVLSYSFDALTEENPVISNINKMVAESILSILSHPPLVFDHVKYRSTQNMINERKNFKKKLSKKEYISALIKLTDENKYVHLLDLMNEDQHVHLLDLMNEDQQCKIIFDLAKMTKSKDSKEKIQSKDKLLLVSKEIMHLKSPSREALITRLQDMRGFQNENSRKTAEECLKLESVKKFL